VNVDIEQRDATTVVTVSGDLDLASAPSLDESLRRSEDGTHTMLLDLRGLTFMDSSGLRVILAADARARSRGGRLVLVAGPPGVQRVFQLTLLDTRLEFVDDPSTV
jgi:anti-sigma B factor antagonist